MSSPPYESIIGLEVHAQLSTRSKAFCSCSTKFGGPPNSNVCPVCLGMPGVLPVLNGEVVDFTVRMGLATNCAIAPVSTFARKNYFYPDLPKGYQISQYEEPICKDGWVDVELPDGSTRRVGIDRIHMEEDAGKLIHDADADTLVDLNRCGIPLIEIVSRPDMRTPGEASAFLQTIRQIVTYLGICDGNMEEGSLRCDANVSVRRAGETMLGTKTEVKNMNSFRFVERAIAAEVARQVDLLESGERIVQETLLWDADAGRTISMRSKEEAHDYRYFPEPDLPPVLVSREWEEEIRTRLPEFPAARRQRYSREFGLPSYDAGVLTAEKETADYFEEVVRNLARKDPEAVKIAGNWTMTEVLRVVNDRHVPLADIPVPPARLGAMINLMLDGTISGKIAKEVFEEMIRSGESPGDVVSRKGLMQISDERALQELVDRVLSANERAVRDYKSGKQQLFGFFVGQTMKLSNGKANPAVVNALLKKALSTNQQEN